jgi:hypothetical protein
LLHGAECRFINIKTCMVHGQECGVLDPYLFYRFCQTSLVYKSLRIIFKETQHEL